MLKISATDACYDFVPDVRLIVIHEEEKRAELSVFMDVILN